MQVLTFNEVTSVAAAKNNNDHLFGFTSANWATIFGLAGKAASDLLISRYAYRNKLADHTAAALMFTSAFIGLSAGYSIYYALEAPIFDKGE